MFFFAYHIICLVLLLNEVFQLLVFLAVNIQIMVFINLFLFGFFFV